MDKALALLALAFAIALLMGCTSGQTENPPPQVSQPQAAGPEFPRVPVEYAATYEVNEGGAKVTKRVWASGNRMRMEIADGSGGLFGLFFLGSRAYSCAAPSGNASCFDVSGRVSVKLAEALPCQNLSGASDAGPVDIGGTQGKCYTLPYGVFAMRKICCTDRGVLAYDEYNTTSGKSHVEYLTDIAYSAKDSDFLLPAEPRAAPAE